MKMNNKKVIKNLITVAMVMAMTVVTALSGFTPSNVSVQAAPKKNSGTTDNGKWTYKYYKKTNSVGIRMVYKKVKKDGKTLTIPNTVKIDKKSYKVTRLLEYQFDKAPKNVSDDKWEEYLEDDYFKKIIIPSNVQVIEDEAFTFGERIKEVQFAKNGNLKTIGEGAFSCCGIRHISIPASVTTIKNDAFLDNDITQITFEQYSKFSMAKDAFEDNPIGCVYDDYEYEPEECVLKVANYDIYKWLNTGKYFGEGVVVRSAKTRLMIDSKKYVDISVGHNGGKFDITKYVKWDKNYDFMGAELGYIDSIFNSNNYKYKSMKVNKSVGSRAYPLMKVNKLLLEEKTYKIKTNNFEMINISGRKNYFDAGKSIYTVGMNDSMTFLPFPTGSMFLKTGYHINGYLVEGSGMKSTIFQPNDKAKALTTKQNTTLSAVLHYAPNKYQIKYDLNGGAGNIESTACTYDENSSITQATPTREKYNFLGWSKDKNDSANLFHANDQIKNWSAADGDVVTLFAQWEKIKKKVELEISPDELSDGEEAEEYLVSYTINGELAYDRSLMVTGDTPVQITIPDLYIDDVIEVTASGLLTDEDENSIESEVAKATIVVK